MAILVPSAMARQDWLDEFLLEVLKVGDGAHGLCAVFIDPDPPPNPWLARAPPWATSILMILEGAAGTTQASVGCPCP